MSSSALSKIKEIDVAFSNTPLVVIHVKFDGKVGRVYGKYEAVGFTGSAKDRMARFVISDAYNKGTIKTGDCIIETSSGNAGIALAAIGAVTGNPVKIFIPDWMSEERYKMLSLYGAQVVKISAQEGGFVKCLEMTKSLSQEKGYFFANQFGNELNVAAQLGTTMTELFATLDKIGASPSCFVAGYGTGGVVMAASRMVKSKNMDCSVHPLEPSSMPLLSTGRLVKSNDESHKIEGIVDDFVPDILKLGKLDEPVVVDQDDAIVIARKINSMGLSFGISSGANLLGCINEMKKKGTDTAATVFCDGCGKYYSTDLFSVDSSGSFDDAGASLHGVEIVDIQVVK